MKRHAILALSTLLMFAVACGSTTKKWDDRKIEADVRSKIADAVPAAAPAVMVRVDRQVVVLSGTVSSEEIRRKIGDVAQTVNGVTTVINNITLPSP